MPNYLIQVACTTDYWGSRVKEPTVNPAPVGPVVEGLGGRLTSAYLAFGKYDAVLLAEMPDNVSAAALSMALSGTGAYKAIETTPLITLDEGREAATRASAASRRRPS